MNYWKETAAVLSSSSDQVQNAYWEIMGLLKHVVSVNPQVIIYTLLKVTSLFS